MALSKYLGKRTLIMGDVNSGKTFLSRTILDEMCRHGLAPRIAIIDVAPEIPATLASEREVVGVGGKLLAPVGEEVIYLTDSFAPPRLTSKSDQEAAQKATENAAKCIALLQQYSRLKRDILFINDISLCLQAESADVIIKALARAGTIIANGYHGEKLGPGALSLRERREMDAIEKYFDNIISL